MRDFVCYIQVKFWLTIGEFIMRLTKDKQIAFRTIGRFNNFIDKYGPLEEIPNLSYFERKMIKCINSTYNKALAIVKS